MAYNFNGTNQYLSMASSPASGSPMTITAWFYPTANTAGAIVSVGQNSGSHRNQITFIAGGTMRVYAEGLAIGFADSSATASQNNWAHIGGVYLSESSRTVFLNGGNSVTNTTNIISQNTATGMQIATRTVGGAAGLFFTGRVAEVGIWNVALTAAEIASLADGMTCDKVRPQSLVFYAPLVRDLQDVRGGLTITNNNAATVATHPRVYA
jgi:hypothetical protein